MKVVYLVDLAVESLKDKEIKEQFIEQFVKEANIHSATLSKMVKEYLLDIQDTRTMVLKCIAGIKKTELPNYQKRLCLISVPPL